MENNTTKPIFQEAEWRKTQRLDYELPKINDYIGRNYQEFLDDQKKYVEYIKAKKVLNREPSPVKKKEYREIVKSLIISKIGGLLKKLKATKSTAIEKFKQIKTFNMESKSVLKTILICITAIICICIVSYAYYESNRYTTYYDYRVDKYNGTLVKLNMQ